MKPEWFEKIDKKAKAVEDKAARLAYDAGLGASEWKAFCSSADLAILDLLSHIEKLRDALESLDHGKKCCPDRLPCHVCKTVRKALLHDPMKGVE